MISLGKKFADYSLTAGLMICLQVVLLFWLVPDSLQHGIVFSVSSVSGYIAKLPEGLITPITALLSAVALISMFFIGLILELIGSIAVIWELRTFKGHLERNRSWLVPLLKEYGTSTSLDVERILEDYGDPLSKKEILGSFRIFYSFWKRSSWTEYAAELRRGAQRFRLLKPFGRAQAFLLSYVSAMDSSPRDDLLRDHLHLCVISRAVSAGLYVLAMEIILVLPAKPDELLALEGLGLAIVALAMFLPMKAYGRYCDGLFSLALVLSRKLEKNTDSQG